MEWCRQTDRQTDSIASFGGNGGRTWPRLTPLNRKKCSALLRKKWRKSTQMLNIATNTIAGVTDGQAGHRFCPLLLSNSNSKTNDHLIAVLSLQTVIFVSRFLFWWITSVVSLLLLCHTFASSISRKRERELSAFATLATTLIVKQSIDRNRKITPINNNKRKSVINTWEIIERGNIGSSICGYCLQDIS